MRLPSDVLAKVRLEQLVHFGAAIMLSAQLSLVKLIEAFELVEVEVWAHGGKANSDLTARRRVRCLLNRCSGAH